MLWDNSETRRLNQMVAMLAKGATAEELKILEEVAPSHKPPLYDAHSRETAIRYKGNARQLFIDVLRKRFPVTFEAIPASPLNLTRFVASQDAGVYELEPERILEDVATGEEIDSEDSRVELWEKWVEMADLATVMPEAERRALIPLPCLLYCGTVKKADEWGVHPRITLYYPHDCIVINHWTQRTDDTLDFAVVVAVKQAAPDGRQGSGDWWWIWSREVTENEAGEPSFGPWHYVLASTRGDHTALPTRYDGERLPFVLVQVGEPEGYVWVDEERDLKHTLDEINVTAANEQFCDYMQGHSQPWTTSQSEADDLTIGADRMLKLMPGAQAGVLDYNPKLEDMREGRKLRMRELAAVRRNSPDAYDVEKAAPESGVARRIGNRAHEAKLNEVRHVFRSIENTRLLPILLDLLNSFSKKSIVGCVPRMKPRTPSDVEDPSQRQDRLLRALDAGGITPARAYAEAGYYHSVEDAVAAGLSNELRPSAMPTGSPLAQRLAAMRAEKPQGAEPAGKPEITPVDTGGT